jgi:hypothetical protein
MIDPAYYTDADGDGQTTATREAEVDVGGDPRPAAKYRPSVPCSDSRTRVVCSDKAEHQRRIVGRLSDGRQTGPTWEEELPAITGPSHVRHV